MSSNEPQENFVDTTVTYTLYKDGRFYIIENVPARVDVENGEQYFSPQTVEHLQAFILGKKQPERIIQTPVYRFA